MFADSGQEVFGRAAVAVRVLRQQWSRSLQSLVVPAGLRGHGWDSALPRAVPAPEAGSGHQCSQWWCSQDSQQNLGVVSLTNGRVFQDELHHSWLH